MGSARFESVPPGALVWIDNTDQGIATPAMVTGIPAGVHTYALRRVGYNDYTGTVTVAENQTAGATAVLTPVSKAGLVAVLSLMGLGVAGIVIAGYGGTH